MCYWQPIININQLSSCVNHSIWGYELTAPICRLCRRTEVLLALWPVLWTALWCPGRSDRRQGKLQGFFPTRSYVLTMDTQGLLTGCAPLLMIRYHRIQYCQSYVPDVVPTSEIILFCSTLQYGTPKWRLKKTMLNTKGCVWGLFNIRWNGIALIACNHHVKPVEHIPSMGERLQGGQHSQDGARHCSLPNLIHGWFKRAQSFKPCWWRCTEYELKHLKVYVAEYLRSSVLGVIAVGKLTGERLV